MEQTKERENVTDVWNENKRRAISYIDDHRSVFTDVSDEIWANPELSLKEFKSAALYEKVLEENGFRVEKNLGGIATAFSGTYGSGHPVIGFLGEFDALSGLSQKKGVTVQDPVEEGAPGHGCGHNMLGAGDLAAAFAVKNYLETTGHEGTVIFFGCPGEEGGAGKAYLARDGMWRSLDAALTWHPEDVNEVVSGTNNSTVQVLYKFRGKSAHAASDPEDGRSALDAVELMNIGVQYLREHMTGDCRVHYAMIDGGGVSPNVVQDHASVLYMVRANRVRDTVKLQRRVDKIADGAAMMTETSYERVFIDGTADVVPNFAMEEVLYQNFSALGVPEYTPEEKAFAGEIKKQCPVNPAPGIAAKFDEKTEQYVRKMTDSGRKALNDFLIPLYHTTGFKAGSTDVGDVSWETPTGQIHCTAFVSGAPGHSWQNVSCGGTEIGYKALLTAGKVLAMTAIDLYEKPELLKKITEEFKERTQEGYVCPIEKDAVPVIF